jgi:hypothetical protein
MRYETPELALLGTADAVVLGGPPMPPFETLASLIDSSLLGYDE